MFEAESEIGEGEGGGGLGCQFVRWHMAYEIGFQQAYWPGANPVMRWCSR